MIEAEDSRFPTPRDFSHAILKHLSEHPEGDTRENVKEAMPALLRLSEAQRTERLQNQPILRYRYRTGWGLTQLKGAGYVENPSRGIWQITDRGRDLFAKHPTEFDASVGSQIAQEYKKGHEGDEKPGKDLASGSEQPPDEQIGAALHTIHQIVSTELLEKIAGAPPVFFEQLVLDLLHALGYGATEDDLERVGGVGDGGFDGVISLDRLGFEKIYVQAKRWQGAVGRPPLQAFYGALSGRRARKGVFITTSSFTREAKEFGRQIEESVVMIDGERLASLMIEHGVGVTHYRILRLPRVDEDYFDSE